VKTFPSLLLDIKSMSIEDKLFNFISGLKPWVQNELGWQKVLDLPSTIAMAKSLVDFKPPQEKTKNKRHKEKSLVLNRVKNLKRGSWTTPMLRGK